jgi:nitroimidazol reductase NimA-like FMN-containing flavoprotein (pyridoxamine 5'-phosphate oxidase superfamily)
MVPVVSDPVPSRRLQEEQVLADPLVHELLDARLVCILASYDRSGAIHAVPMWCASADDCVLLATGSRSRKTRNLEADGRATLVLHDSRPGFEVCGVSMTGLVEIVRDAQARELVDIVHARYVDSVVWSDPEIAGFLDSDDIALRFRPRSALTWDERGSVANVALRARGGAHPLVSTQPRP